jgi:hypothetical protein
MLRSINTKGRELNPPLQLKLTLLGRITKLITEIEMILV